MDETLNNLNDLSNSSALTSNYQDCKEIYDQAYTSVFSSGYMDSIWLVIKGLAVALILYKWYHDFFKGVINENGDLVKKSLHMWTIIQGILYITMIAAAPQIINLFEGLLSNLESTMSAKLSLPESTFDLYEKEETSWWNPGLEVMFYVIKYITLAFVIVIDYMYFLGRALGLLLFQMVFPLSITLGLLDDRFMSNLAKQLRIFAAIYLSGFGFLLAIYLSNEAFIYFDKSTYGAMPIVALLIVLFAKKAMYNKVESFLSRIFS